MYINTMHGCSWYLYVQPNEGGVYCEKFKIQAVLEQMRDHTMANDERDIGLDEHRAIVGTGTNAWTFEIPR